MAYYFVKKKHRKFARKKKILGVGIISCGVLLLAYFFFPLAIYQFVMNTTGNTIAIPVPAYAMVKNGGLGDRAVLGMSTFEQYNDARNWYPSLHVDNNTSVPLYTISIPKLKIIDASVSTKDYDLTKHLIQYAGTAIPGQNGTAVIFGHSTLPQWFDPKNYKTIFATLHTIKEGDEITVTVNSVTYAYKVFAVDITTPEDTNMFSQSFDHSYLTIVTCTPPGTVWKRLVVRASLEQVGDAASLLLAKND